MSEIIKFIPPRVPLTDPRTGLISREWYLFFQGVFNRIGGTSGPSTTDTEVSLFEDAGSGETNAALFALEQAMLQEPQMDQAVVIELLQAELSGLRDTLAELAKDIQALKQSTT